MLIPTHTLTPQSIADLSHSVADQTYNGLDCCLTYEIFDAIAPQLGNDNVIYNFERALQAPVLEMMLRGFRVDELERRSSSESLRADIARLENNLQLFAYAVWGKGLNARSSQQLQEFFYRTMNLPEQWTFAKGKRTLSMNREALEKLENYFLAMPIVATVLAIRDLAKQLQVFETEIDPDGRYRTSFNIAGTETGRFSSSKSQTGTGGNAQNISAPLRRMFEADPGFRLFGIDLEQAESREVGWNCGVLFNEWGYYDAALAGDLHTTACRLIWPKLPWTGEDKKDRAIAEQPFYRQYSYRDMAKRGGHGCLTADHEVLTPFGWELIHNKPAEIMTFCPLNGSTFATVSNWIDKQYTGQMVEVDDQAISFKATADHKVLGTTDYNFRDYAAGNMPASIKIPKGWGYVNFGTSYISPDYARFLAAFHADGHQKSTNICEFHLTKARKITRLKNLCAKLNFNLRSSPEHDKYFIGITLPKGKQETWPDFSWSAAAIEAYVDEYPKWDGHAAATSLSISSKDIHFLELFQTFARLIGKGGNIQKPRISGYGTTIYTLQINNRQYATNLKAHKTIETVNVYCPTVPSGYFYIRRNGKISVTGNSNYYGKPFTMARHLHVPKSFMESFQENYFLAFPGIPKGHRWTATQLQTTGSITTKFGRQRHFFGRPNDDTTLREAIAFDPQSCTADRTNLILWRLWKYMPQIQLLTQEHDAIYFQAPEHLDPEAVAAEALTHFDIPFTHPSGRKLIVPGEVKVGWNKGNYIGEADVELARKRNQPVPRLNPNGLRKLRGPDKRQRQSGLFRVL